MKKLLYIISASCGFLLMGVSCDSFLDKAPEENMSIEQAFAERAYTERFLSNIYSGLPTEMNFHEGYAHNPFVGGSDEMEITSDQANSQLINNAALSPSHNLGIWRLTALSARKCNLFLKNIKLTNMDPAAKNVWIGEVHFLRAFYNFLSLRVYGPLPLYDKASQPSDDFTTIERATFSQCVDFITSDCEQAFNLLPAKRELNELGRASAAAALALKARVLLYAASPLYNGNSDYVSLVNSEGEKLFPDYSRQRWQDAANAAKRCIDFCEGTLPGSKKEYQLYRAASGKPIDSHYELFVKNWNSEVLFACNLGVNAIFEQCVAPRGLNGLSVYAPTQQMVDAYEMANGKTPFLLDEHGEVIYNMSGQPTLNAESGYAETGFATKDDPNGNWTSQVSNMYVNREPRFYAHINFCGGLWGGHTNEFWYTGSDGQKSGGANYTKTGYLIKKFSDKNTKILTGSFSNRSWIYFRLGEVYLNYAEALNEAKDVVDPDVYIYVNAIRERAGLDPLPKDLSSSEMKLKIRHERRIELAFESHRYFDCRRWKLADQTENQQIYGLNIGEGTGLTDPDFYRRVVVEKRRFVAPRNYLFPIERSEIQKDPALRQNIGY